MSALAELESEREREREMCICKEEHCMRWVAEGIILMSLPVPLSENMKPGSIVLFNTERKTNWLCPKDKLAVSETKNNSCPITQCLYEDTP